MRKTIFTDGDQLSPILAAKSLGFNTVRCHHDGNDYVFMQKLIDEARKQGIQLWFSMDWDFHRMGTSDGGNHRDEICARYDFLYRHRDVVLGLCAEETEYHPDINVAPPWPLELIKNHFNFVHQAYPFFDTQLIVCGARDRSTLAKQTVFEYYLGTTQTKNSSRSDFEANVESFVKSLATPGATKSLGLCLKATEDDVTAEVLKYQIDVFKAALSVHKVNLELDELVAWVWDWDSHPEIPALCDTKSIQQAWKEIGNFTSIVPPPPPPSDMTPIEHLQAVIKKLQPQSLSVEGWQGLHRTKEALFWLNEDNSLR